LLLSIIHYLKNCIANIEINKSSRPIAYFFLQFMYAVDGPLKIDHAEKLKTSTFFQYLKSMIHS
jgi:hypothetical protein